MSIVLSAKHIHPYIPLGEREKPNPRTYYILTPTRERRASFRRAVTAAGIFTHHISEIAAAVRATVELAMPEDGQRFLDLCDHVAELSRLNHGGERDGAQQQEDAATMSAWAELSTMVAKIDPKVAGMMADNQHYNSMAPAIAASVFLNGWINVPDPKTGAPLQYKRGLDGHVLPDLLEEISDGDIAEIWIDVLGRMNLGGDDRKNSASPSPATGSQAPTESAAESTNVLPMVQPGSSSASDTNETQS